jgi:hypothetical protein
MHSDHELIRIMLGGMNDIQEWRLGDPALASVNGYPLEYPAEILDDRGILFVDVALNAESRAPVCHEVNGPNAVGSDALTGDSSLRAESEARQTLQRMHERGLLNEAGRLVEPVATVHAHQHWSAFRTGGEFYPRVGCFSEFLGQLLPDNELKLRGAGDALEDEQVAIVMGDVPSVTVELRVHRETGRLEYQGRPVVFVGNPNVIPELRRTGKLDGLNAPLDLRVLHAWRLTETFHDKGLQQELLRGTGISPLRYFEARSLDEACVETHRLLTLGPVVLKPSSASGGTGVHVVVPQMDGSEIRARVEAVVDDCVNKYGTNAESTVFPIRGFEFVRSTGYPMMDGDHLWDLRIAVLFEPGKALVFPVSLRVAPEPFDPDTFHDHRDQWLSNVSGRHVTLLKSGMDELALSFVGLTKERLTHLFHACVVWTMKAWDLSVRDGGTRGGVYEDVCEIEDASFYPRMSFHA